MSHDRLPVAASDLLERLLGVAGVELSGEFPGFSSADGALKWFRDFGRGGEHLRKVRQGKSARRALHDWPKPRITALKAAKSRKKCA